tara:strand:+ start:121 stop:618 length:498 start_codon:yes stop_codon:yes gene_type:complete
MKKDGIKENLKKKYLIDLLCTLVKRRLYITNEVCLSQPFGDNFWLKVRKHINEASGIHENHWFSIEAGSNHRPRKTRGYGHKSKEIIDSLRTLLEDFDYGYNCDMNGIWFQLPSNYQTEILCYWDTPAFISDYSAVHDENGRVETYIPIMMAKTMGVTKTEDYDN